MKKQIENAINKVGDTARSGINSAVDATQARVSKTAKVVADTKKSVQKVQKATLAVNAIGFRMLKELIELQSKSAQHSLDAVAGRLRDASRADTLRELLAQQRGTLPGTARFYMSDVKSAFGIVKTAGSELITVAKSFGKPTPAAKAKKVVKKAAKKKPVRRTKAKTRTAAKKVSSAVADAGQAA